MPWLLASPGQQHPWYWLYRKNKLLLCMWKYFNYLCPFSENDINYIYMFMFPMKNLARKGLKLHVHANDVAWVSWRLDSPANQLFVQKLVRVITKPPHCQIPGQLCWEIHWLIVVFTHNRSVMRKAFRCYGVTWTHFVLLSCRDRLRWDVQSSKIHLLLFDAVWHVRRIWNPAVKSPDHDLHTIKNLKLNSNLNNHDIHWDALLAEDMC